VPLDCITIPVRGRDALVQQLITNILGSALRMCPGKINNMCIVMLTFTCTTIPSSHIQILRVVKGDLHAHGVWIVKNSTLSRTLTCPLPIKSSGHRVFAIDPHGGLVV
jgi:hypothetical protein